MVNVEIKPVPRNLCLFRHDGGTGMPSVKGFLDDWNAEAHRGESEGNFTMFVCPEHYREVYEWAMERERQAMVGELTKR